MTPRWVGDRLAERGLAMLLEAGLRTVYRRSGDVAAQIEWLPSHRWQVTITVRQPGGWELDDTIPIIDLGAFPDAESACDAADLVLDHWSWARAGHGSGRSLR